MVRHLRTIGAAVGLTAVCFMLASLSWQWVLLGFALASIAWALWSASVQLSDHRPRPNNVQSFRPHARRPRTTKNVYSFPPAQEFGNGAF